MHATTRSCLLLLLLLTLPGIARGQAASGEGVERLLRDLDAQYTRAREAWAAPGFGLDAHELGRLMRAADTLTTGDARLRSALRGHLHRLERLVAQDTVGKPGRAYVAQLAAHFGRLGEEVANPAETPLLVQRISGQNVLQLEEPLRWLEAEVAAEVGAVYRLVVLATFYDEYLGLRSRLEDALAYGALQEQLAATSRRLARLDSTLHRIEAARGPVATEPFVFGAGAALYEPGVAGLGLSLAAPLRLGRLGRPVLSGFVLRSTGDHFVSSMGEVLDAPTGFGFDVQVGFVQGRFGVLAGVVVQEEHLYDYELEAFAGTRHYAPAMTALYVGFDPLGIAASFSTELGLGLKTLLLF